MNVDDGADLTECDLTTTEDSVFEVLGFLEPGCISRTAKAEDACNDKAAIEGFNCACIESDIPGSQVPGGQFEAECDEGEVCHCNSGSGMMEVCVSHTSKEGFDPLYGSTSSVELGVQYVLGGDDVVSVELLSCEESEEGCSFGYKCNMTVNAEYCSSCELCGEYTGGFSGDVPPNLSFDCSNVIDDGTPASFDLCTSPPSQTVSGVFHFLSNDECMDEGPTCTALFEQCDQDTDCCSGRCLFSICRTASKAPGKDTFKIGGDGRGGAGGGRSPGRKRRRIRGL